jgi:hypothetical protein
MHARQLACIGQIGQIAADGLQRDAKALGQILDHNFALAAGNCQDFWVAKPARHGALTWLNCPFFQQNMPASTQICNVLQAPFAIHNFTD